MNEEFNEAMVWVEKYEKGILADDPVSSLSSPVDNNGMIIFSMQRPISEFDKTIVNVSISNDEGSSSGQNLDDQPKKFEEMSSAYSTFDGEAKFVGDELILATICFSKNNEMGSLTTEYYENPEAHLE
ncbi:hypothetical protein [Sporosarcina gallistercoris]|uniref:Uncharacterized protein n=1 Tax=Sporosarcina gallistercoris TaxID=2762245 RepID=A0ABR8PMV1_9BACL|nr:hypothetical protein [Sporosarcina gallistercoris]MBD7909492.1 hypothetical protein [Sporosarcina gallistercoris]